MEQAAAISLIERILCAAQAFVAHEKKGSFLERDATLRTNFTYLRAYCELAYYLRHLFLMYDAELKSAPDASKITSWPWADFLQRAHNNVDIEEIVIVTFNYDLFLEHTLDLLGISYEYEGITTTTPSSAKVRLYKPHGSINFVAPPLPAGSAMPPREIDYKLAEDFSIQRPLMVDNTSPQNHWLRYSIIPPAGDSARIKYTWVQALQASLQARLASFADTDRLVICGLSYWHVDRAEIDGMLAKLDLNVDAISINPRPSEALDGVLSSLFVNYSCFPTSSSLRKVKI
ncbi:SIR2 family protein [Pelomonas sp. P7]|uniref:SIR2 family protein n=1 Tax=Pelomonas caseinilytica TaxID=2906763 RepID=A0ABS8XIQ3_9BURK|nr:SIR2 family protein [Pelomonas sp. P7]MCE4539437.1 SIR2 family protein [Pelomonas sp. P7]